MTIVMECQICKFFDLHVFGGNCTVLHGDCVFFVQVVVVNFGVVLCALVSSCDFSVLPTRGGLLMASIVQA